MKFKMMQKGLALALVLSLSGASAAFAQAPADPSGGGASRFGDPAATDTSARPPAFGEAGPPGAGTHPGLQPAPEPDGLLDDIAACDWLVDPVCIFNAIGTFLESIGNNLYLTWYQIATTLPPVWQGVAYLWDTVPGMVDSLAALTATLDDLDFPDLTDLTNQVSAVASDVPNILGYVDDLPGMATNLSAMAPNVTALFQQPNGLLKPSNINALKDGVGFMKDYLACQVDVDPYQRQVCLQNLGAAGLDWGLDQPPFRAAWNAAHPVVEGGINDLAFPRVLRDMGDYCVLDDLGFEVGDEVKIGTPGSMLNMGIRGTQEAADTCNNFLFLPERIYDNMPDDAITKGGKVYFDLLLSGPLRHICQCLENSAPTPQDAIAAVESSETAVKDRINTKTNVVLAAIDASETAVKTKVETKVENTETAIKDRITTKTDAVLAAIDASETAVKDKVETKVEQSEQQLRAKIDDKTDAVLAGIADHDAHITTVIENIDSGTMDLVAAHDANITGLIQSHDTSVAGQLTAHGVVVGARIDTHDASMSTLVNDHDSAVRGELANHDTAVTAQVAAHDVAIGSRLDGLDADMASRLSDHDTAMTGRLDTHDADMADRVDAHDTAMAGRLDTHDADMAGRVDAHDTAMAGRLDTHDMDMAGRVNAHDTAMSDRVDAHDTAMAGRLDTHDADMAGRMDAHDTSMSYRVADHDTAVRGELAAHDANIESDLAAHDTFMTEEHDEILSRLNSGDVRSVGRDLAGDALTPAYFLTGGPDEDPAGLVDGICPSLAPVGLPRSPVGGDFEFMRCVARANIDAVAALGYDTRQAERAWDDAEAAWTSDPRDFRAATENYAQAVKSLMSGGPLR